MRSRLTYLVLSPRTPARIARAGRRAAEEAGRALATAFCLAAALTFTLYVVAGAVAQAAGR